MYELVVDGVTYNIACSIKRKAEIKSSDVSGMLMDKNYHNDVIATYMQYDIDMAIPRGEEANYASLYEVLTDPVASHVFILPYNQTTLQINARVEVVSDEYYREIGNTTVWRKTSFTITANEPSKVPT